VWPELWFPSFRMLRMRNEAALGTACGTKGFSSEWVIRFIMIDL
jgi:hypothetical protein